MVLPSNNSIWTQKESSPDGIEPLTFRLTAERADRLRHGDCAYQSILKTYGEKETKITSHTPIYEYEVCKNTAQVSLRPTLFF